jgi:hypothetical protein
MVNVAGSVNAAMTEWTLAAIEEPLARGGPGLFRLFGPALIASIANSPVELRDQHLGRRPLRLFAFTDGACRRRHRDAVPGAFGQADPSQRDATSRRCVGIFPPSSSDTFNVQWIRV